MEKAKQITGNYLGRLYLLIYERIVNLSAGLIWETTLHCKVLLHKINRTVKIYVNVFEICYHARKYHVDCEGKALQLIVNCNSIAL